MTDWDELFRKSHFPLEEPQRQPAVLCDFLRDSDVRRIYDLGCSLGQNLMFLAERGFELYGTDLSETALMRAREKADGMKLRVELVKADMKSVLFIGSLFRRRDMHLCYLPQSAERDEENYIRDQQGPQTGWLHPRHFLENKKLQAREGYSDREQYIRLGRFARGRSCASLQRRTRGETAHVRDFEILSLELEEHRSEGEGLRSHWHAFARK